MSKTIVQTIKNIRGLHYIQCAKCHFKFTSNSKFVDGGRYRVFSNGRCLCLTCGRKDIVHKIEKAKKNIRTNEKWIVEIDNLLNKPEIASEYMLHELE